MTDLIPAPVKGMKFAHATRKNWRGDPVVGTVTSVSQAKGMVYWSDGLHANRMKTPLKVWGKFCGEVLEMPEPRKQGNGPRLTKGEAAALHQQAHAAGVKAADAHVPTPMVVQEHANPLDDNSPVVRTYEPVMGGVCGFAKIVVTKGNGSFARWLRDTGYGSKNYEGGTMIWVRQYGQSMEKKSAYAEAYAKVLNEAGVEAYASAWMD